MCSAKYGYFVLLCFMKPENLEAESSFFDISSKSDKAWNPSYDFFDEKSKGSASNDQFQVVNIDKTTKLPQSYDSIEAGTLIPLTPEVSIQLSGKNQNDYKQDLRYKAYFIRFIKIFLRTTGIEKEKLEEGTKTVTVDMKISKRNIEILKNFGSDNDISFEVLEDIFTSMFLPVDKSSTLNMISSTTLNMISSSSLNMISLPLLKYILLISSLIAAIIYTVYLILQLQSNKTLIIFATLVAYISVVSLDLLRQYEDVTEKMILKRMEFGDLADPPKECFPSKLSLYEKIWNGVFRDDVCKGFLDSRKSIWYNIDIASAFIKPFSDIFSRLCLMFGEGAEKLITPILDKCPWPLNIILNFILSVLQLPMLIFCFCIIVSTLSSGTISLKIPFFTLTSEKARRDSNFNDSRKPPREALEERHQSGRTEIINHSGGIILLGNNHSSLPSFGGEGKKDFLNLQPTNNSGTNAIGSCYSLQTTGIANFKKGIDSQDTQIQFSGLGASTSTNLKRFSLDICESSNKNKFPIPDFSRSISSDNVLNRHKPLLNEKLKQKSCKSFKRTHYNWKAITDEHIKDLFQLRETK